MSRLSIQTRPHWPLPSPERLPLAKPTKRFLEFFVDYHAGLREIQVQALGDGDGKKVNLGTIQHLMLTTHPGQDPLVDAETLCRVTWLRGEKYARGDGKKVQFRVYLSGVDKEGDYRQESRFTVRPEQCLPEEPEIAQEYGADPSPKEDEEDNQPIDDTALVRAESVVPSTDAQPIPVEFALTLQNNAMDLARRAYEVPMQANTRLFQEIREQNTAHESGNKAQFESVVAAITNTMREVTKFSIDQLDKQNHRIESLEKLVGELTRQNYKQYENLQQLASQGWVAFLDAMKMKSEVIDERIAWTRQQAEEIQRYQPQPQAKTESAALGMLAKGAPMFAAGLAILMRKRGDVESATFLEDMARRFAGPLEDEDDDESDEYVDTDEVNRANGRAPDPDPSAYVGHEQGAPSRPASPSFADRARMFRSSLSEQELESFRKELPKPAWRAFEGACSATQDAAAIAALQRLEGFMTKDPPLMMRLGQKLSQPQIQQIMAIVADVKKVAQSRRPPPQRPGAPA